MSEKVRAPRARRPHTDKTTWQVKLVNDPTAQPPNWERILEALENLARSQERIETDGSSTNTGGQEGSHARAAKPDSGIREPA